MYHTHKQDDVELPDGTIVSRWEDDDDDLEADDVRGALLLCFACFFRKGGDVVGGADWVVDRPMRCDEWMYLS